MPGFAFASVGPLGLSSPPSRPGLPSPGPRYYAPLRLPLALPGSLRLSLASRYLVCLPAFVSPALHGTRRRVGSNPAAPRALGPPVPLLFRLLNKETNGSPKFPSYPFEYMPRSQTPVVSWTLAWAKSRTAAFRPRESVGFPSRLPLEVILTDHNDTDFGALSRSLHSRYTRLRTPHYWNSTRVHFWPAG